VSSSLLQSGAFVVLKTDFQNGGDPPIWKIDGKALLQKYVPFEQDGKTLYKNTSTVSTAYGTKLTYTRATGCVTEHCLKQHDSYCRIPVCLPVPCFM